MPQPTYDAETLRKVALLAARMQSEQERLAPGQHMTAEEMDRIGEEVGLSPALMRQALGYLQAEDEAKVKARRERKRQAILGLVACLLFAGAGTIAGYKWFVNTGVMSEGTGGRSLFNWPQINVYFQRPGEPTLDDVVADIPVTTPVPLHPMPPSVPGAAVATPGTGRSRSEGRGGHRAVSQVGADGGGRTGETRAAPRDARATDAKCSGRHA